MDVLKLSKVDYSVVADPIQDYTSMIWTERHQKPSDFELRTPEIERIKSLLPEKSLIGIRGSKEVMIVEDHEIDASGKKPELVVTGRSALSIFEHRYFCYTKYNKKRKMVKVYSSAGALAVWMWNSVINPGTQDKVIPVDIRGFGSGTNGHRLGDNLPNAALTLSSDLVGDTPKKWWVQNGDILSQALTFMRVGNLGVNVWRPPYGIPMEILTNVDTAGVATWTLSDVEDKLLFRIYQGVDRSYSQTTRPQVIFSDRAEHLDNPKYLFSSKNYKQMLYVDGDEHVVQITEAGEVEFPDATGWERSVGYLAASSRDEDEDDGEYVDSLKDAGLDALRKNHRRIAVLDGQVNNTAPYTYGSSYNLGDIVTVLGRYGVKERMQVVEYIRTKDRHGTRGYPALSHL